MSSSSPAATAETSRQNPTAGLGNDQLARRIPALPIDASDCPPHEMSYSTREKLQYGGGRAQEGPPPASPRFVYAGPCVHTYLHGCVFGRAFSAGGAGLGLGWQGRAHR